MFKTHDDWQDGTQALELAELRWTDPNSQYGYKEVVQSLIRQGASLEATSARDNTRCTALIRACQTGRTEIVRILLEEGAKVNEKMNYLYTPKTALHTAVENSHEDIVTILLKAGADPNAVCRVGFWEDREHEYNKEYEDNEDSSDFEHAIYYAGKAADGHSFSHSQLVHRESVVRELSRENQVTWDDLNIVLSSGWAPIHFAIVKKT